MHKQDVKLPFGDHNEMCIWRPDAQGPLPVMIYSPGFNAGKDISPNKVPTMATVCNAVVDAAMAFVSFTPYSWPGTGGEDSEFTYGRWSKNIEDIYHWLCDQDWVDPERIGCFAVSSGSTTAVRYAQRASDLKFIVSVATCLSLHVGMGDPPIRRGMQEILKHKTGNIPPYHGKKVSEAFYIDSVAESPIFNMQATRCPIFFMQGSRDNFWRQADAWMGYQALRQYDLPAKYLLVKGGDHWLSGHSQFCAEQTLEWLRELGILSDRPKKSGSE